MLSHVAVSRMPVVGGILLDHDVGAGTFSAAPTVVADGFYIRNVSGNAHDAFEMTYSFDATADATTAAVVRPWFWVPEHDPLAAGGIWLAGAEMEDIRLPTVSTDIRGPVRRISSVPVAATKMYLQVVSIGGTGPANLYMVVYGIDGNVADINMQDIEVDIEASTITIGAVKLEDGTTTDRAHVRDANAAHAIADHVLMVQLQDDVNGIMPAGDIPASRLYYQPTDSVHGAAIDPANTARSTATVVQAVQHIGPTGEPLPAGDTVAHGIYTRITDGTNQGAVDPANTARSTATVVQATQNIGANGYPTPSGAFGTDPIWTSAAIARANYFNPNDFTVAFTTNVTVTVAGAPFVVNDANCRIVFIMYRPTGGDWQPPLINGIDEVSFTAAANVITVAGAGTPFAAGDEYWVGLQYQDKGYDQPSGTNLTLETNPPWLHNTEGELCDVTDGEDDTYYYPLDPRTFTRRGIMLILDGGSGTVTVTLEASIDPVNPYASAPFIDVSGEFGAPLGWTADEIIFDDTGKLGNCTYLRVKVVAATGDADDADWRITYRQTY